MKKSFTLVEILVVLIIIGILGALAYTNFGTPTEKALDKEARATLALMRAAERIYKMEVGTNYYPYDSYTSTSDLALINTNLKVSLPTGSPKWTYSIDNASSTGVVQAARSGRSWSLNSSSASEDPTCTGTCL